MMTRIALCALVAFMGASEGYCNDVYVIRFLAQSKTQNCHRIEWIGDVQLLNVTTLPVDIELIGMSGSGVPTGADRSFILAPNDVFSFVRRGPPLWLPVGLREGDLWVLHLNVPAGVLIENRDEGWDFNDCDPGDPVLPTSIAKISLPIIRALADANKPQMKLGTDLGPSKAHQNVVVYNGGEKTATAHIEVHRSCDNSIAADRFVTVEPNGIIQVNGIELGDNTCTNDFAFAYGRYTVVTVDQPSFTLVSSVAEPRVGNSFRVDLTVQ